MNNFKKENDKRTYKILLKNKKNGLCPYCDPYSGCNFWNRNKPLRNWKSFRKKQYKNV